MAGIPGRALRVLATLRPGIFITLMGLVVLVGCQISLLHEPEAPAPEPQVLVAGCDAWFSHNTCESKGPLTVWIEGETPVPIELPDWTPSKPVQVRGGFRRVFQPPAPQTRSVLRYGPLHRTVVTVVTTTASPALDQQLEGMSTDELLELAPTLALDGRAQVLDVVRQRIMRAQGLSTSLATTLWLKRIHRARGDDTATLRASAAAVVIYLTEGEISRARLEVNSFPSQDPANSQAVIVGLYHRAILERDSGATRSSVNHLLEMELAATRVGNEQLSLAAAQVALPLLDATGLGFRSAELEAELIRQAPKFGHRARANILTNVAWSRLLHREAVLGSVPAAPAPSGKNDGPNTTDLLEAADTLFAASGAPRDNSLLNRALNATQQGDYVGARAILQQIDDLTLEPNYRPYRNLLVARVCLKTRDFGTAERYYRQLVGQPGLSQLQQWEALNGLAETVETRDIGLSLRLFAQAEALAHEIGRQASLLTNMSLESARTLASSRAMVDILGARREFGEAWRVARSARRRLAAVRSTALRLENVDEASRAKVDGLLRALHAHREALDRLRGDVWSSPKDEEQGILTAIKDREDSISAELSQLLEAIKSPAVHAAPLRPAPGQVFVMLFPGRGQWWVLVRTPAEVRGQPITTADGTLDIAELGSSLDRLLPASASISEVRFYATGATESLDLHAAPFRGQALGLQLPVTYALDAGASSVPGPPGRRALLVGAPSAYLGTDEEIEEVGRSLQARGFDLTAPQGEGLRTAQVAAALNVADLFHFAGHAEASDHAVRSGLRLQEGQWLSAADILALRHCPRTVVLAACETARPDASAGGWTLAEAFIAAGAHEVLATQRKIEDSLASQIARRVQTDELPLHVALHQAVSQVAQTTPQADWAAFRVLVP